MKDIIRIVGGTIKFERFIKACCNNHSVIRYNSIEDALDENDMLCRAYIFMPDYENSKSIIPQMEYCTLKKIISLKKLGQNLYIENYDSYNHVQAATFGYEKIGGLQHILDESIIGQGFLEDVLSNGTILQARNSYYYKNISKPRQGIFNPLLSVGGYIGNNYPELNTSFSIPVLYQYGTFYSSLMNLTEFDELEMIPYYRWKNVFAAIFSRLLNVQYENVLNAFETVWKTISTTNSCDFLVNKKKKSDIIKDSVKKAVKWHLESGIIPDKTGKSGCFEMIESSSLNVYKNQRVDSGLYTGFLLKKAGCKFQKPEWEKTGENLVQYFLSEGCQIDKGELGGLFKWYLDLGVGPFSVFSIDSGRCGIAMINMYRLTKLNEYLERSIRLGDGFLRWMTKSNTLDGVCANYSTGISNACFDNKGEGTVTPAIYAEMTAFLMMLYKETKDVKYRDTVYSIADNLVKKFPNFDYYGHTTSSRCARFLITLLTAQENGGRDYSDMINKQLKYISNYQDTSGGIYVDDNLTLTEKKLYVHGNEAGVAQGDKKDKIADILYCINNIMAALSIVKKMKNYNTIDRKLAVMIMDKLVDFMLNIQITSNDKRLDGGWMRAYDIENGEYFGLNIDKFWGAYCIMAGWTMGIIPLALLDELDEECIYI